TGNDFATTGASGSGVINIGSSQINAAGAFTIFGGTLKTNGPSLVIAGTSGGTSSGGGAQMTASSIALSSSISTSGGALLIYGTSLSLAIPSIDTSGGALTLLATGDISNSVSATFSASSPTRPGVGGTITVAAGTSYTVNGLGFAFIAQSASGGKINMAN